MKIFLANIPTQIPIKKGKEKYFVKAGCRWPYSITKKRKESIEYKPFPFYLAYTSTLLKQKNFDVFCIDGVSLNYSTKEFIEKFKKFSPDILITESQTPTIKYDLEVLKKLKSINPKLKIILCGTHPTTFFKQILKENSCVDVIALREYEFTCQKIVESNFKKLDKIPGVAFIKNNKVVKTEPKELDVNKLPFPDRESFPISNKPDPHFYWDGFCQFKPTIQIHASRGCPFRCNFCLWNQVMYCNGPYRGREAKKIVNEMEYCIKKYSVKEFYFDDDTFTGNKKHVLDLCNEISKRNLKVKWSCMGDAMITDEEMIDAMSKSGCIGIKFGVESGNKKILQMIEKPINYDRVKKFVQACVKRKIKTHGTFTFGIMGETKDTMKQTLNLAKSLDIDNVQFSITTPFPGTRYFDLMDKEGRILSKNWGDYDGAQKSVVSFGELSQEEIRNFLKKAHSEWLKHKKKDFKWMKRKLYCGLKALPHRGIKGNLSKIKLIFSNKAYG